MAQRDRTADRIIGRLATRRHGVVTRPQLLGAGVTPEEIRHRLGSGALLREHPGVYRVGHRAPSVEATCLAAVWACGPGSLLSGLAAAHLLGLLRGPAPPPEVLTPTERRVSGVRTRRSRALWSADGTTWNAIPVTTVPRTLVDLAARLGLDELARACHEAGVRHRTTPGHVKRVLERLPAAPGRAKLTAVILGDVHVTLSRLESRFLGRLRAAGLPLPETNRRAGSKRVDCRWREHGLTVELDSYRFHNSRYAWNQDRRREREAYARGDQHRRYTWGDVFEDPVPMLTELGVLLPRARPG
jgi:predicted transcriptional regulator of viral defense system